MKELPLPGFLSPLVVEHVTSGSFLPLSSLERRLGAIEHTSRPLNEDRSRDVTKLLAHMPNSNLSGPFLWTMTTNVSTKACPHPPIQHPWVQFSC